MDNPQLVFEAMNSTGKKLSQADLIRNYVLMDLPPKQQEKVYSAYWRPMELEFSGAEESQFDEFVRHYLTNKTGEIPRLDDIYDAFKYHATAFTSADEREQSSLSSSSCVSTPGATARWRWARRRIRRCVGPLKTWTRSRLTSSIPSCSMSTPTTSRSSDSRRVLQIVNLVTSYIFRRAVCRIPTNSLNKTFAGFSSAVRKDRYLESVTAHFLGLKSYRRFPTDAEFVSGSQVQ